MSSIPRGIEAPVAAEPVGFGRSAAGYYALMALAGLVGIARGVVYAKILGGVGLGYYALVILIATYAEAMCHLGLYPGLECHLPTLYGAGRRREAADLRNLAAGFMALLIGGLVIAALITALVSAPAVEPSVVVLSALLIGSLMLFGVAVQDLRSRRRTLAFGSVMLTKAALSLSAGALGAWAYGYGGALSAEIVVNLALFAVLTRFACEDFRFRVDEFHRLRPVMRIGMPLVLKNVMNHLSGTLDRWCIVALLGVAAFAQYSFAMLLVSAGLALHAAISMHLGPHAAFAYGRDADIRAFFRSLHRLSGGALVVFVLAAIPFSRAVDWIVPRYFAEFQEGGRLLVILYWGVCFQIIAQYEWVAMALKRTGILFWTTLVATVVTTLLYASALWAGASLAGLAWIFVGGRALNTAGQLVGALIAARLGAASSPSGSLEPALLQSRGI